MTPAAGPDSMTWTGRRRPSAAVITPPFDCMIRIGAVDAERRQLVLEAAEVLLHDRQHVGVGDGRADVRSNSRTSGSSSDDSVSAIVGRPLPDDRGHGLLVARRRRRRG